MKGIRILNEGPRPIPGDIRNKENSFTKIKNLFKNNRAHFNKNWHNSFLCEGDSSLFKWRARLFPLRDKNKIVKIHWRDLKIDFSRTIGPIWSKLGTKQVFTNEGSFNSQNGDSGFLYRLILALGKYVYWLELFLRWATWPKGLLLSDVLKIIQRM